MGGGDGGGGGGDGDGDGGDGDGGGGDGGGGGGGDGGDGRGGGGDDDPYKKDPSLGDLAREAGEAGEWTEEYLGELFDWVDRKLSGESTADDDIVWDAVSKAGTPPSNAKEAAEYAAEMAEVPLQVAKTGWDVKQADNKKWKSGRGHKGDEHLTGGGDGD
jgi:hypothetical protein